MSSHAACTTNRCVGGAGVVRCLVSHRFKMDCPNISSCSGTDELLGTHELIPRLLCQSVACPVESALPKVHVVDVSISNAVALSAGCPATPVQAAEMHMFSSRFRAAAV